MSNSVQVLNILHVQEVLSKFKDILGIKNGQDLLDIVFCIIHYEPVKLFARVDKHNTFAQCCGSGIKIWSEPDPVRTSRFREQTGTL